MPQAGTTVLASDDAVMDPDGRDNDPTWQWWRLRPDGSVLTPLNESRNLYTFVEADVGLKIGASISYMDGAGYNEVVRSQPFPDGDATILPGSDDDGGATLPVVCEYTGQRHSRDWSYYTLSASSLGDESLNLTFPEEGVFGDVCGHDGQGTVRVGGEDLYCADGVPHEWVKVRSCADAPPPTTPPTTPTPQPNPEPETEPEEDEDEDEEPTPRRLGRGPWRPGSGGARAGSGTWCCGCCGASHSTRSRVKSGWSSIAWRRGRRGRWPVSSLG